MAFFLFFCAEHFQGMFAYNLIHRQRMINSAAALLTFAGGKQWKLVNLRAKMNRISVIFLSCFLFGLTWIGQVFCTAQLINSSSKIKEQKKNDSRSRFKWIWLPIFKITTKRPFSLVFGLFSFSLFFVCLYVMSLHNRIHMPLDICFTHVLILDSRCSVHTSDPQWRYEESVYNADIYRMQWMYQNGINMQKLIDLLYSVDIYCVLNGIQSGIG